MRAYSAIKMSFRIFLLKGVKLPLLALGSLFVSGYGAYQWHRTKEILSLGNSMSEEKIETIFQEIDVDGNGLISEEELLRYLQKNRIKRIGKYDVHAMMVSADETKDGNLSLEEWRDLIKETHTVGPGTKIQSKISSGNKDSAKFEMKSIDKVRKKRLDPHDSIKKR